MNHPARLLGKSGNQTHPKDEGKESDALFAKLVEAVATAIKREGRLLTRSNTLLSLEPIGLNRARAAAYVGVSPSLFDEMVSDGRMPRPRIINSRTVWDRRELDVAFDTLPTKGESLSQLRDLAIDSASGVMKPNCRIAQRMGSARLVQHDSPRLARVIAR